MNFFLCKFGDFTESELIQLDLASEAAFQEMRNEQQEQEHQPVTVSEITLKLEIVC